MTAAVAEEGVETDDVAADLIPFPTYGKINWR